MSVAIVAVCSNKVVSPWHSVPHVLVPAVQVRSVLTVVLNVGTLMATAKFKP